MFCQTSIFKLRIILCYNFFVGEIPKRLKGSVSKTDRRCKPREGSNPSFSAIIMKKQIFPWLPSTILISLLFTYGLLYTLPKPLSLVGINPLRINAGQPPLLIAHGGGNHEFPDNTLEAFYHAYSINSNVMLETDVNLTLDEVIILSHDTTLDRKTNLIEADIIDIRYEDLLNNQIDFAYDNEVEPNSNGYNVSGDLTHYVNYLGEAVSPLDVQYPSGVTARHPEKFLVSTLEELITLFPNNLINVEIKQTGDIGLRALDAVIDLMDVYAETHQTYQRIVLATFHDNVFQSMKNFKQTTHPQLQFSPETNGVIQFFVLHTLGLTYFFNLSVSVLQLPIERYGLDLSTAALIANAHQHNIAVHYWTIDDESMMEELILMGADGIMTNRPSLLQEVIDRVID